MSAGNDRIHLQAEPFHASILNRPLTFPAPYIGVADHPDAFNYWWRLLQYVYDLPSPTDFPAFPSPVPFDASELRVLDRYVATCSELAESSVLSHRGGLRLSFGENGLNPQIEANFPSNESLRGTTVLFRQVSSPEEPASYTSVRKIVGRRVHEATDSNSPRRSEEQRAWNRAHGGLQQALLVPQADRRAAEAMGANIPPGALPGEDARPQQLISMFQYGDLIHWGRHSEDLEALMQDDFLHKWTTLQFMETLVQLSHLYLGYAVVVQSALGRDD